MMGLYNPSFLFGVIILLYLTSFVLFAILRIATGISIQRIGYFSLRRIAYTPREGIRIEIRGLGLHLHRPTFAQPTWISLRLEELKVTVDIQQLVSSQKTKASANIAEKLERRPSASTSSPKPILRRKDAGASRSRAWKRLTGVKDKLKQLHEKIHWLRLVDFFAQNSSLVIANVGHFEFGTVIMLVDTRRKTVDRGRLFQHKKVPAGDQRPAEWVFTLRGVLFTPDGKESLEVIDILGLNIHGLLYKDLAGLRDTSIALKLGRIHIPYDDFVACSNRIKELSCEAKENTAEDVDDEVTFSDVIEELDRPGSREANIVQTVSDSKEFVSSILRGIQEIQMAVSFVGLTKEISSLHPSDSPLHLNFAMNEFGIDMHRLDPKSPAHRMYFSPKDVAHQALLAAISIGVSVDDGHEKPERLIYVPMATTTVKTTLPSKTVAFSEDKNAAERNANILFANFVLTSPSVDVDPRHMPVVLSLLRDRQERKAHAPQEKIRSHHLLSRLLPKASMKMSVHEPVIRVALPPSDLKLKDSDEYDLLICAVSSISFDTESSHSAAGELHYALMSSLRLVSHHLYYQTSAGERHNLLLTEALDLKIQVTASPQVCVIVNANIQTFSMHMVRPEISTGVRQIVQHIGSDNAEMAKQTPLQQKRNPDFLRPLPTWLVQCYVQGSNFSVEIAGMDSAVSEDIRGVALQLESWTADYKIKREAPDERPPSRRHIPTNSSMSNEPSIFVTPPVEKSRASSVDTDDRRLAVHIRGFEGFVVEAVDATEQESFLSLPRFEVAFSTSSDHEGPIFHINSYMKALYLHYSLYRYYAFGVAMSVLRNAFAHDHDIKGSKSRAEAEKAKVKAPSSDQGKRGIENPELVTVDIKTELLQIKARMPADPPMMLQIYGMEAGQHRWAKPFLRSRLVRIFAEAPQLRGTWARIASAKTLRIDLREVRKKRGSAIMEEKSFDIATDFVRLAVPHQLVMHKIFDNFINVMKASAQLHHRFKTGTNEYILKRGAEEPKVMPRISIRTRVVLFDIEDGPFDWKLGSIYRVGLIEQRQRLAREEAFKSKAKHLEKLSQRSSSRYRNNSSQVVPQDKEQRSKSESARGRAHSSSEHSARHHSQSPRGRKSRRMRYDPEGKCKLTEQAKISIDQAWQKLQKHNAQSWKRRIDNAYQIQSRGMRGIRSIFWGNDELPQEDSVEGILSLPERPGLMSTLISDLHVVLDKPSFPINQYADFLHRVGKGMPRDMKYSLLIPLSVKIDMGEARVTLRDYPLPLIHVPAIRPGQSPRLPSWSLKTDFVIAEEYRGDMSSKTMPVEVVPLNKFADQKCAKGFAIDVQRTVSPVKTYSDVGIAVNTNASTSITWGTSLQPAIQDMMMVIEGFTKPQVDPSDRTGFWDKIRLVAHSRVNIAWTGDGDVHLNLKGSRDPYVVTGHGAGFVMVWRKDVRWNINQDDDPKKFMTVDSGEYVLAIPDFSRQAREHRPTPAGEADSLSSSSSYKNSAHFKKTIMKLSGDVRWLAGLVFERNLDEGGRSFDFRPHYDVTLTTPDRADQGNHQVYDAFRGFRSNHIHLSIAVAAPLNRDWTATNVEPSMTYNSTHLTPKFFTHFFDWWSMFSGVMSLPIRQGKLFPGLEKTSKKFGRHLATIKYNLLLSPLFITHMYKHKDVEEYAEETVSATGLKLRLNSFMLDLHQRREEFITQGRDLAREIKTSAMRIHQTQLDFISADLRAVSAKIRGTSDEYIKQATDAQLAGLQDPATAVDLSKFTIPDNDLEWVDMDDFNELDWILPSESDPETFILPLAFAPRFTYFRQTDHLGPSPSQDTSSSPFGNEPTHYCVMSHDNDPRKVQCYLIEQRLEVLEEQFKSHARNLGDQELKVLREVKAENKERDRYDMLSEQGKRLEDKKIFLESMLHRLRDAVANGKPWMSAADDAGSHAYEIGKSQHIPNGDRVEGEPLEPAINEFSNRFVAHNVQLKWNNSLRNVILRYVHQVSQRRGFIYYLTRRAVKFIVDIVEEQNKNKYKHNDNPGSSTPGTSTPPSMATSEAENDGPAVEDRIRELLNDGKQFVDADDPEQSEESPTYNSHQVGDHISKGFTPLNTYHVRLIAPQIQLQSEKNAKSVLLVTAKSIQLQVIQIMDKDRMADDVSGLVQRRFSVDMDSAQFFVAHSKNLKQFHDLYLGNDYGSPQGTMWPPWVPFENNFDFDHEPFGWSRVVSKTSASLRYEKHNTLRLKYNDEISGGNGNHQHRPDSSEGRIDHLWVDFPHIRAICDSAQYFTMYVIVLDLLLYSEPLEKVRSEKLEKIMLASDFSDLRGAPEMVSNLQTRIRQLEEIKNHFQVHRSSLDRQGWLDNQAIEQDLVSCEDELFFMMKAITTSQRKQDDRLEDSQSNALLRWYLSASEIVWHLMREKDAPLMLAQLNNVLYDRIDNSDGSNHNTMEIDRMLGKNMLPDALYPEMLGPYYESGRKVMDGQDPKMLKVSWHNLEAIAGIPVLDQFEVDLFPLKVQLEREIGQKLFEYIFPGLGKNGTKDGGFSPLMVKHQLPGGSDDSDSTEDASSIVSPPILTVNGTNGEAVKPRSPALDMRLRATTKYPDNDGWTASAAKAKQKATEGHGEHHFSKFFHHSNNSSRSPQTSSKPALSRSVSLKHSQESLKPPRKSRDGSSTSISTMGGNGSEKHKRFGLNRSSTQTTITSKDKPSDDLSLMLSRASNYMTLAYVKIPSVVLCLSYKGKGDRNIEDVHNFVFRMPVLEYRNKTWSNYDLALRLQKDVTRALISHTGAIISNKFSHSRPSKQSRLRHLIPNTNNTSMTPSINSEASSFRDRSPMSTPRDSITSYPGSELSRTDSFASSLREQALQKANGHGHGTYATSDIAAHTEEAEDTTLKTMRSNFTRRFTAETQKLRRKDTGGTDTEDPDESNRKNSVLLLGKKILGVGVEKGPTPPAPQPQ